VAHRQHHQAVGDDADHDRGNAREHFGDEADDPAESAVALLGQKDPGADAERDPDG
jgi:hypothetical protein